MRKSTIQFLWVGVAATVAGWTAACWAAPADPSRAKALHVQVRLTADREGVEPGGRLTLGLVFDLEKHWHIYWRYHGGGAGLPTTVTVDLPAGWTAGEWQFPAPTSHLDELGERSYILDGTVVLLSEVTAGANARPGTKAEINVSSSWLVCRKECVKGDADLTLTIPVVARGSRVKRLNEDLFEEARQALPVPAEKAKYVRIGHEAGRREVRPGDRFEAKLVLEVEKGHHIQSARPITKGLIATEVFLDPPRGFLVDAPRYPPGKERVIPLVGRVSEYGGRTIIPIPVEIDEELSPGPTALRGVVRYQTCNEAGTCYPPIHAAFEIPYVGAAGGKDWEARPSRPDDGADVVVGNEPPSERAESGAADGEETTPPSEGAALEGEPAPAGTWLDAAQRYFARLGPAGYLAMALIGGFVLNFMPCVLPVISIKILSFVRQAHEDRWRTFALGLAFCAGVIASFAVLGVLILAFDSQWGGLFQRPQVLIGLAAVVTAFALSLFGVFSLNPPRAVNELGARVQGREGLASAFGTGLLATVLGTACTAPFLSAAVAVATGLARRGRHAEAFGVFLFAGLGMAMPYALLTWQPAWLKVLPRPGPWMEVFERAVGFVLLATVVWLLSPLAHQIGTDGLMATLVFLLVVAVAAWLFGRRRFDVPAARRAAVYLGLALMLGGGWFAVFRWWRPLDVLAATQWEMRLTGGSVDQFTWRSDGRIPWVPYTRARAEAAVQSGRTVFVDYTAEWCVNCKANEKLVLETSAVRSVMKELGVVPFKADFTSFDAEIRADLSRYGRSGVPMYLVIPANRPERATVLPEVLTVGVVVEALRAAGPSVEARVEPVAARP